ncbi:MAG: hypothetical protein Q9191_002272 [Dirinaria sp. TL-2023a]
MEATESGVSVQCVNNVAFMTCINRTGVDITVSQIHDEAWAETETAGGPPRNKPTIAALDNAMICVWNEKKSGALQWKVRDALDIPPLDRWMSALRVPLTNYISTLTIPGTHDTTAISDFPFVGCQTMTVQSQLMSGIRYFDIRAGFKGDKLVAYHGGYAIHGSGGFLSNVEIAHVFTEFANFLEDEIHRKEFLIVQIKQDQGANDPQEAERFGQAINSLIEKSKDLWLTGADVPTLEKARGKIQLIRRFPWNGELGIDVFQAWNENDNSDFFSIPKEDFSINIQDHWNLGWDFQCRPHKYALVKAQMDRANKDPVSKNIYINFASAVAPNLLVQSKDIAIGHRASPFDEVNFYEGVNPRLRAFFNNDAKPGHYGIILMDYPEEPGELLLAMIKTIFLELRTQD